MALYMDSRAVSVTAAWLLLVLALLGDRAWAQLPVAETQALADICRGNMPNLWSAYACDDAALACTRRWPGVTCNSANSSVIGMYVRPCRLVLTDTASCPLDNCAGAFPPPLAVSRV